jgi:uncharacterized membrane protein YbhN (UPF0104 family)
VRKLLRPAVSVSLLAWVAWHTDWPQVAEAFGRLRLGWWLAACGVLVVTQVVSALRWRMLARPMGFGASLGQYTSFYFIGMFFNLVLPTSVGGDVVRALYLDGRSGRRLAAFTSVLLDRVSGFLVLLALAGLGVLLSPLALPAWVQISVAAAVGGVALGLACLPLIARLPLSVGRKAREVLDGLRAVWAPRLLLVTTLLSVAVQVANIAIVWLIGVALGAPVPFTYYWVLVPMVTLLTLLPSVNGTGVREGAMVLYLAPVGVGRETALTLAFLWFAVFATVSLSGGLVYLFGRFPSPARPAGASDEGQSDHGPVDRDSDQGRARQSSAAA